MEKIIIIIIFIVLALFCYGAIMVANECDKDIKDETKEKKNDRGRL